MTQPNIHLDPNSIQTVIDKAVEELTDEDIDNLIAYFRKQRETFVAAEAAGKKAPRQPKAADPSVTALLDGLL